MGSGPTADGTATAKPAVAAPPFYRITDSPSGRWAPARWTRSDARSVAAADEAGQFFLRHRLYRRLRDGNVINPAFMELHYPCYWHHDILFALTVFPRLAR